MIIAFLIAFLLLHGLDIHSTMMVMKFPGGYEVNPFMRSIVHGRRWWKLAIIKPTVWGLTTWVVLRDGFIGPVLWLVFLVYVWAVCHNYWLAYKGMKDERTV